MTTNPYSFLDGCLNFLLLEDDPHYQDLIMELLEPAKIFTFYKASSSSGAIEFLKEKKRVHICILDLGISDFAGDEFYILRSYADYFPCIVLTGSQSPSKGATCIQFGAKAVMEKGVSFEFAKFYASICYHTIRGVLNKRKCSSDTLNNAIDVLMNRHPSTVTEWAEHLLITDRQMRNLWHDGNGFGAKHILGLHILLSNAFRYYQSVLFRDNCKNGLEENRSHSFYINNRKKIDELLSSSQH